MVWKYSCFCWKEGGCGAHYNRQILEEKIAGLRNEYGRPYKEIIWVAVMRDNIVMKYGSISEFLKQKYGVQYE